MKTTNFSDLFLNRHPCHMLFPFNIRNPHHINPLWQTTNIDFIRPPHHLNPLPEGIVHLHFGSLNTFYRHLFLCQIGINE